MGATREAGKTWNQPFAQLAVALVVAMLVAMLWWQRADQPPLQRLELLSLDTQMLLRGPLEPRAPITIVGLDERSAQALGGAVLDRQRLTQLITQLKAAQARVVALDILLLEPSREPGTDQNLAQALREAGMVMLPIALPQEPENAPPAQGASQAVDDAVLRQAFSRTRGEALLPLHPGVLRAPLPLLAEAAAGLGHVSTQRSVDGAVPYDLPALLYDGEAYPSLALRIAGMAQGLDWSQAEIDFGERVRWGALQVPLDALSRQWVNYYGPAGRFDQLSLVDVLEGKLAAGRLLGRIVLVGSTALGTGDAFPTPFDSGLPGVERLATVTDNLISGRGLRHPPSAAAAELAAIVLLPLLVGFTLARGALWRAMLLQVLLLAAVLGAAQLLFVREGVFVSLSFPLIALLAAALAGGLMRAVGEQARRRAALQALRESEERYALAAQGANDGLWDWDLQHKTVYFSSRWRTLMGLSAEQARDMSAFTRLLSPPAAKGFEQALQDHLNGRSLQLHHVLQFEQGGQQRYLLVRGVATRAPSVARGAPGAVQRMAGSLTDISESQRLQQQLSHDALHDRLTGLPNRSAFRERLTQMLAAAGEARQVGMLLLGLDDFRAFNESHGTLAGDAVLRQLAERLTRRDGQALSVARLGGDEFAIAFLGPLGLGGTPPQNLPSWALKQALQPFAVGGALPGDGSAGGLPVVESPLTASVGWAHGSQGLASADELMAAAESAMVRAKADGPGHVHAYDPAEQLVEHSRRWMREQIDRALLEGGQFQLHYQPFIRLADRRLLGFEALLRWRHPERGLIMPGDFIPIAEASGQIEAIGRWTLLEAAAQLKQWVALGFAGEIAVNVSGVQLERDENLMRDARDTLAALGDVPTHQLKLEVTESMAMANPTRSAEILQTLGQMGFKLSIDDFGTGYSSLAYLHRFPFDTLKVDRSFVMRLAAGREAQEIVRTIVGLALALGKQTLAEGVEDEAQAQLLLQLGVQVGQGWLFAKALPSEQAQALVMGEQPWVRAPR